ncbi:MAG: hypothetical protein C0424_12280 [Sphingobacteriaceae bacterium]|nr:hypothetical protein [Sphingobacteriaceae bacterium]
MGLFQQFSRLFPRFYVHAEKAKQIAANAKVLPTKRPSTPPSPTLPQGSSMGIRLHPWKRCSLAFCYRGRFGFQRKSGACAAKEFGDKTRQTCNKALIASARPKRQHQAAKLVTRLGLKKQHGHDVALG